MECELGAHLVSAPGSVAERQEFFATEVKLPCRFRDHA